MNINYQNENSIRNDNDSFSNSPYLNRKTNRNISKSSSQGKDNNFYHNKKFMQLNEKSR